MQGLADGYFVLPYTIGNYLSSHLGEKLSTDRPAFQTAVAETGDRVKRLLSGSGKRSVDSFHRELGKIVWDYCGIARNAQGLGKAMSLIPALEAEFWRDVRVLGGPGQVNQELEKAGRLADFFELAQLMCRDALDRDESCGGHLREEHQTEDGEALRDDEHFSFVSAWEWKGPGEPQVRHEEPLRFEAVEPSRRSYK
jgi:succinate dehydrogenase / fumarate reductase, flavoprotein subunit